MPLTFITSLEGVGFQDIAVNVFKTFQQDAFVHYSGFEGIGESP